MEQIDGYCERTDFSFWAEPVNAVTNVAFLFAAILAFVRRPRSDKPDWPVIILIAIVAIIGIGSFLFHTFATRWAALADVLPIMAFIFFFFFLAMRRLFAMRLVWALVATGLFFFASRYAIPLLRPIFGVSAGYVPALAALILTGAAARLLGRPGAGHSFAASAVFAASLSFRIVDEPLCAQFPTGTHFMWHVLNAVVLFILLDLAAKARIHESN